MRVYYVNSIQVRLCNSTTYYTTPILRSQDIRYIIYILLHILLYTLHIMYRQLVSSGGVIPFLGDYVSRCLVSKAWILRDGALNKAQLNLIDLLEGSSPSGGDGGRGGAGGGGGGGDPAVVLISVLPAIAMIVKLGVEDKNLQVNFSAYGCLEYLATVLDK